MPPLWFLRYAYFVKFIKDSKLQAKHANINLESYVSECWDLTEKSKLYSIDFQKGLPEEAVSTVEKLSQECSENEAKNDEDWCAYGICLMKQMPDEMLEQVFVLSTICVRW